MSTGKKGLDFLFWGYFHSKCLLINKKSKMADLTV